MKQFISFVIKEGKHILRDKRTMLILFGMPLVLMLIFGFAITTDVKNVRTIVVTSSMDHLTQQAVDRLAASEYFTVTQVVATPREAERVIRSQKADMAIVFGPDFASKRSGLQLIVDVRAGLCLQTQRPATDCRWCRPQHGAAVDQLCHRGTA